MKIISWNVNGIRAAYPKGLASLIAQAKPDIFCLQEIKAQTQDLSNDILNFGHYRSFFSSAIKKGYSGVANFCLDKNQSAVNSSQSKLGQTEFDNEGRFILTEHPQFDLYNIYFPSGTTGAERQDFKYKFLDFISEYFKSLPRTKFDRAILCGDINICHREIDIHHPREAEKKQYSGFLPDERKWFSSFLEMGFVDAFRQINGDLPNQYTWWSYRANSRAKNLGWRIDYFLISQKLKAYLRNCQIHSEIKGSDHCPISIELSF